jgi:hypothetical protein
MTSPSPSEPTETEHFNLIPDHPMKQLSETPGVNQPDNFSFDSVNEFVHSGKAEYEELRWLCLTLANRLEKAEAAPSPELQRTGEAKELCSQIATRYKQMIQRRAQDDDDILGDAEMQTLLECALEELSTHYEAREAQLRAWRPIRTAPTDGTLILLYILNAFGFDHVKVGFVKGAVAWSRYFDGEALGEISESGATHWMPLPATPAMKTPEQD